VSEPRFVDCHSHVVPSGDDGATSARHGIRLCREAARRGTAVLFATPHVWPELPLTPEREEGIRAAFERMRPFADLDLRLGYELTPSRSLLAEDPVRYRLEGTDVVLMEVPFMGPADIVFDLAEHAERSGLRPVIAHPERSEAVLGDRGVAGELGARGWLLQVNASSLLGRHGPRIEELGWRLVEDGAVRLVASDGHREARPAALDDAYAAISARLGADAALPLFDGTALDLATARPTPSRAASPGA
jgi:protein-tyrosine phosphatase